MSRIAVSEDYLRTRAIPTAQKLGDPHRTLTDISVRTATPAAAPQPISAPPLQKEELAFNQGPNINPDAYQPVYHQKGGTLMTLAVLLGGNPQAKALIGQALKEQQLMGAASHA